MKDVLFEPGLVGALEVRNRIFRAGTSESMAEPDSGAMTTALLDLYERLAAGGVGGIITGHLYVDPRGKYARGQTGIHDDSMLPGLSRLTERAHSHGATIFAQLAHAGSQSRVRGNLPIAPSPVPNPLTGNPVAGASTDEIDAAVAAFGAAATRAVKAGFDGVHIHGANGYLISEFSSPVTNRRDDRWGGDSDRRGAFSRAVVESVRRSVPSDFAVTMKIGMVDAVADGLDINESVQRAGSLVSLGLDAVEVSCGLMQSPSDSANTYVAVDSKRAAQDLLVHRLLSSPRPEAYFRPWAAALRDRVETTVILTGGMRTTQTMREAIGSSDADFVGLARPFIREPDLVSQIEAGREGLVDCTSCNLCLIHEGHHPLQCWRTPRRRLIEHAVYKVTGGFRRADVIPTK